jgi:hypothetical protein
MLSDAPRQQLDMAQAAPGMRAISVHVNQAAAPCNIIAKTQQNKTLY